MQLVTTLWFVLLFILIGLALLFRRSRITGRWRVFLAWSLVMSGVWLLLNAPRTLGGKLAHLVIWKVGFPWTFAHGEGGERNEFVFLNLLADLALGVAVVGLIASLCAWSRRPASPPVSA